VMCVSVSADLDPSTAVPSVQGVRVCAWCVLRVYVLTCESACLSSPNLHHLHSHPIPVRVVHSL